MYSGNNKFSRGGGGGGRGGGATKRSVFGAAPPQRLSSSTSSGRLSLGGSRNPPPTSAQLSAAGSSQETFSLVGGNALSFAAIIRLAPDLVEEIRRVEAHGGAAKIKFDSNPNNALGNVIDVGGKEFHFTWSRETGDLCDIYEERQSGEDGNGLLVESGCAWRKLNVQRVLDESAKNHVKRLSEEAERQLKSRKAKFLDPSNASMKSQMKALVAAEASPWKFKHRKDYFKKRNFEPPQVGGPPKAANKSGLPTTVAVKGRHSASPLPSPQNQSVYLASPSMKGNATVNQAVTDDTKHIQAKKKENTLSVDKDLTPRSSDGVQEAAVPRDSQVEEAKDVQSLLITLLKENPKGMNIKTLEKAVADRTSNSASKIEPILEKIGTFKPPGIYLLKPGVESGSWRRSSSDSGSSREDQQKHYVLEENLESALISDVAIKSLHEDLEEQGPTDESNLVEKIDPSQHFSDLFGDDEPPDDSEGQAASSRESGSDSDSDSSDSGSDSGSRSRSRSPAGTASGSGSDSENDSSSNSKDRSDVEIDILNDDDKEPKKLHDDEQVLSRAAVPWSMPDAGLLQEGNLRDQEGYASEDIDIDKDSLGDNEAELAPVSHAPAISTEKLKAISPEHDQSRLYGVADMRNEPEDVEEEFKHEQPDSLMRFKSKPKRGFEANQFEESSVHFKRLQSGSMAKSSMSGYMQGISPRSSPDITNEDHQDNHNLQVSDSYDRNDNSNLGGQGGYNHPVSGKFSPDLLRSGRRPPIRSHDTEPADKFGKVPRSRGLDGKHQETNAFKREGLLNWGDKGRKEMRDGESTLNEKINGKSKAGAFDKKQDTRAEPHYGKHGEEGEKSLTMGNSSRLQLGSSPKDGGQVDFDRDSVDKRRLERELSDLELGELRDPLPEEPDIPKRQFERVGSFKQSDSKSSTSGSQNADFRGAGKPTADTGSPSLPESRAGGMKNVNNWSKRRSPEPSAEDFSRPSHQTLESQQQQPRGAHTEVGSLLSKAADVNSLRANEGALNEGADVEGYGESQKKSHASAQLEESKQDTGSRKVKGSKSLKSNKLTDASDRRKDTSSTEGHNGKRKRSGSSLDEDVSYSKYEKKEPELKGPIKNFSEYTAYVQEYCEKYESYCSLNKILESYRNEFQKLGTDLESAKGRDMEKYYDILAQLRESYRQHGMRHKRLKKIFIVLHEELKHLKQRIKEFAAAYMRD